MGSKQLTGLTMTRESRSYTDAMHGVLTHCGWFGRSKAMLAGMTVNGFRFSADRQLSADSWHAYNWIAEHFLAADFIGITASSNAGFSFAPTFPLYQKHAVAMIKQSIDNGIGSVFWKDDFVIAAGYDDDTASLFYVDGTGAEGEQPKSLPYSDFGRNESPYWYYQTFEARIALDELEIYKESFMQAIFKWETHDLLLPKDIYACGKQAYDVFIDKLDDNNIHLTDRTGAGSLIQRYAAAKRDLAEYTAELAKIWPACVPIADCYAGVAERFDRVAEALEACLDAPIVPLMQEAGELEDQAVQLMKAFMRERVHNRFEDIALR
ncbi:hypothetical protein GZH47_12950 [Paenibacillus rhizovicinus]|uniref:Uncharacterized protein n=1 Tax=Paenibacillus rhizovicinus TaxID=2704463 RepID=A0A6C0P4R8_9BACL|nr:hypothetical protein [Paenibacillus rhizovicinus]QHW31662.1 hypothetical protein GZH47_12950 [Paenibacillus rhizovicinus]